MKLILCYIVLINIIGLFLVKKDKERARRGEWRVPEKRIWLIAIIGGGIGVFFAMKRYRHKTKHKKFMLGIPLIIILQIIFILKFSEFVH
jgi:uncharacterized membrane protein YsdA (DUF1294 family)